MRKNRFWISFAAALVLLTGCQQIGPVETFSEPPVSSQIQTDSSMLETSQENALAMEYAGEKTWMDQNVSVTYPYFSGEGEDAINDLVRSKALEGFQKTYPENDGTISGNIHASLSTLTNNLLSVSWQGEISSENSGTVFLNYTTNIDLRTGQPFVLSDMMTIDDGFVAMIRDYVRNNLGSEYVEYLDGISDEELLSRFQAVDTPESGDYSLFTDGTMTLLLSVPEELGGWMPIAYIEGDLWQPYVQDAQLFET